MIHALVLAASLLGSVQPASEPVQPSSARWKIAVLIPEQHLARPRVPDPAAETEIARKLLDAGYKVMDRQRLRELKEEAVVDRVLRSGRFLREDAVQLGRRVGADIVIRGEAISEVASQRSINTDLGTANQIVCAGRLELAAYWTSTAELIFSDHVQHAGPAQLTEILASKAAFTELAGELGAKLIERLDRAKQPQSATFEVEIRDLQSATQGNLIRQELSRTAGVEQVDAGEYTGHTMIFDVRVSPSMASKLATLLESGAQFKKFKLTVQSSTASKIVLVRRR